MAVSPVVDLSTPTPVQRIQDPTVKVKAPESMLVNLGNTYVNLSLAAHGLERLYVILSNQPWDERDHEQPTSVMGYVRANQFLSCRIEELRSKLEEVVGSFHWGPEGLIELR